MTVSGVTFPQDVCEDLQMAIAVELGGKVRGWTIDNRGRGLETGSREHNFIGMSALDGNSMAWQEVDRKYKV